MDTKKTIVKKMGRPRSKTTKENTTLRFYPKDKKRLIKKFGSIQAAMDYLVNEYFNSAEKKAS